MKSSFIVFEGIDGSGKTTLIQFVFDYLKKQNKKVKAFQEPTHYETGKKIRKFLKSKIEFSQENQLKLFSEDRENSVHKNILPNLNRNFIVLLDRFYYSTCAYQANQEEQAVRLFNQLSPQYPKPNLLFYLDIKPQKALARCQKRNDLEKFEQLTQLIQVQKNYQAILKKTQAICIDTNQNIEKTKEQVFQILSETIR